METKFAVFRKMEKGEPLKVGVRPNREEAEKFITILKQWWPADYIVQESSTGGRAG